MPGGLAQIVRLVWSISASGSRALEILFRGLLSLFSEKAPTGEIAYKELQPTGLGAANLACRMQYET
jgi:hypothetical protein